MNRDGNRSRNNSGNRPFNIPGETVPKDYDFQNPPRGQCSKCGFIVQPDSTRKPLDVQHSDHTCKAYEHYNQLLCFHCERKGIEAHHYETRCRRRLSN
jgi:ribosomal protein L34E